MNSVNKIVYIPLDDRPVNLRNVQKAAENAGVRLLVPPQESLGHFTVPGDPDSIATWLTSADPDVDAFVISADMICYGGLVASRTAGTNQDTALKRLKVFGVIRSKHPKAKIFVSSILMRLTVTASDSRTADLWKDIFRFNELSSRSKADMDSALTQELDDLRSRIPEDVLAEYFSARARNHIVNKACVDLVTSGVIDEVVIGKEDCAEYGPHKAEEIELMGAAGNEPGVYIMNGADELGAMMLTKAVLSGDPLPVFAVRYAYPYANVLSLYEDVSAQETVRDHMSFFGIKTVQEIADSDMVLFVNNAEVSQRDLFSESPRLKDKEERHHIKNFAAEIYMVALINKQAVVADVRYANGCDLEYVQWIKASGKVPEIRGFSGFNTASNAIGLAVSQALLPYDRKAVCERIIEDAGYYSVVRPKIRSLIESKGISPFRMQESEATSLSAAMSGDLEEWAKEYFSSPELRVKAGFPWSRLFEIDCDIIQ